MPPRDGFPQTGVSDNLLTFVHISDTHLTADPGFGGEGGGPTALRGAEALVRAINGLPLKPDFVLHTGDVVNAPDPAAYAVDREVLGRLQPRVYYLAGNHDDPGMLQRVLLGRQDVLSPLCYAFECRGVQVVCLDSTGPAPLPRGSVSDQQMAWLEEACAAPDPRPLVVALHHNPLPIGSAWWDDFMSLTNGEAVHAALLPARSRLRGVFFGHVHQNVDLLRDGILYASCPSPWRQFDAAPGQQRTIVDRGADPGFRLISLTLTQTFIRRCRFNAET